MAKIVIIAPADADIKDAVKVLKSDGHDVDIEEPTPKALLHIVLGLFGANAYGFGAPYAVIPGAGGTAKEEEEPEEEPTEEPPEEETDADVDDFQFESIDLGKVRVDGELIDAVSVEGSTSRLCVTDLDIGPRIEYHLNESTFSYWPSDLEALTQRVTIDVNDDLFATTLFEVSIVKAEDNKPKLEVGSDLRSALWPKIENKANE